jgi:hypothetical protein
MLKNPRYSAGIFAIVINLSPLQPVDAMTVPSNRTASGFGASLARCARRRQEETWVVLVH